MMVLILAVLTYVSIKGNNRPPEERKYRDKENIEIRYFLHWEDMMWIN